MLTLPEIVFATSLSFGSHPSVCWVVSAETQGLFPLISLGQSVLSQSIRRENLKDVSLALFFCARSQLKKWITYLFILAVQARLESRERGQLSGCGAQASPVVTSLVEERGLELLGFHSCGTCASSWGSQALDHSSCGTRASSIRDVWDHPAPGLNLCLLRW